MNVNSTNLLNHIGFVLDMSLSMDRFRDQVVEVADSQVTYLAQRASNSEAENRMTIFTFNTQVKCVYYDKDVLRLPSLKGNYRPHDNTALIDATVQAIEDLRKTPEIYADHAFLLYVFTDGEENSSRNSPQYLASLINNLPDNWTVACLVPNQQAVFEAKRIGFPASNVAVWNVNSKTGFEEVGQVVRQATDSFMKARTQGVRGTKNIFQLDTSNLKTSTVQATLQKLNPGDYKIFDVNQPGALIAPFVESVTQQPYRKGSTYYQISKSEIVQAQKHVCVLDKSNRSVYTGNSARQLLGLPDYEIKVRPSDHPNYEVFIQSTSVNRKLVEGTKLLLLR